MEIISHRGNGFGYPENSLPAFEAAIKQGFSIELDIRMSKDSIPFIIHNASVDGILDGKGKLSDLTSNELKEFCYEGTDLKLLSFQDFVKFYNNSQSKSNIFVHIQDINEMDVVNKVIEIISSSDKSKFNLFAIDEMSIQLIDQVKQKDSSVKVGLHLPEDSDHFKEDYFKKADFIWVDEINGTWFSKEMVNLAHKLGKKIYVISPEIIKDSFYYNNYLKRWRDIIEFGFDGICTDFPKEFKNL